MSKKEQRKDDKETRRLTDLPVADETADKTRGGIGVIIGTGGGPHIKVFDGNRAGDPGADVGDIIVSAGGPPGGHIK